MLRYKVFSMERHWINCCLEKVYGVTSLALDKPIQLFEKLMVEGIGRFKTNLKNL